MTIILAGFAALFLAGSFALLFAAALGPFGIAALVTGVAIFVVVGLQYLVWGWWLGPAIRRDAEAEEERQRAEAEHQSEDL